MIDEWQAVARDLLTELGSPEPPLNVFELAYDCGFDIYASGHGTRTQMIGDRIIRLDETLPEPTQQSEVAFALGRWALHRAGVEFSEEGAEYISVALLLSHDRLVAELGDKQDYRALAKTHPLVCLGITGRRIRRAVDKLQPILNKSAKAAG